ncbi:MAG: amine oxidase [Solirubrobacterales bacterium]|nr:amine oxidase [Solirubrobacterales bacterium]
MPRTPLAATLQRAAADAAGDPSGLTRRQIMQRAGVAAAAASLGTQWLPAANAATAPRIVVVGGGLAGLSAAYALKKAGYAAQVHEASDRLGGRCWTLRGAFADGQVAEHGGELIDQGHTEVRQLAQELGLSLDNLLAAEANGTEEVYRFDGQPYTYAQATSDLKAIWQQIHSDVSAASYPTRYDSSTQRGRELDNMSVAQWIAAYVPGGAASKLGQLLDVAYNIEYGAETDVQSSLNMLYLLGYSGQGQMRIFGPSNEKSHVRGGNDQLVSGMAARLPGQITTGSELVAVKDNLDGTWSLSMLQGTKTRTVVADRVVLALPFSILRSSVDISKAGFPQRKRTAIANLGMGTNSKLHVGFSTRHWNTLGNNGATYADTGYQSSWDVSRGQPGASGILVDYTGGTIGASFGSGTPDARARQFLTQIEPLLPGLTSRYTGKAAIDYWQGYRWTKGSYSYFKVGQYQAFAGAEAENVGSCHFAGEHTSQDFQGYLNGAVESGQRSASEILAALK